jgi:hypothetical protein
MDNRSQLGDYADKEPAPEDTTPVLDAVPETPQPPTRRENPVVVTILSLGWALSALWLAGYGYFWSLIEKIVSFWRDPY